VHPRQRGHRRQRGLRRGGRALLEELLEQRELPAAGVRSMPARRGRRGQRLVQDALWFGSGLLKKFILPNQGGERKYINK